MKQWTIMVYMAAGTNLSNAARENLLQMKQVDFTQHANVIAQFDSGSERVSTKRYCINRINPVPKCDKTIEFLKKFDREQILKQIILKRTVEGSLPAWQELAVCKEESSRFLDYLFEDKAGRENLSKRFTNPKEVEKLIANPDLLKDWIIDALLVNDEIGDLGQTNTGSPKELSTFIQEVMKGFNAVHYMLIIWGHGNGLSIAWDAPPQKGRAPADTLTTNELESALQESAQEGRRLDILGFDSCTMGMIEVYYQLKDLAKFGVGAEGYTPTSSWPYHLILGALRSDMEPQPLAEEIVKQYGEYYAKAEEGVDLSACDLAKSEALVEAIAVLSGQLNKRLENLQLASPLVATQFRAQSYNENDDYADLYDLCLILKNYLPRKPKRRIPNEAIKMDLQDACDAVMKLIEPPPPDGTGMVLKCVHGGSPVENSHGLSIYFPCDDLDPKYKKLRFIERTNWRDFLESYSKKVKTSRDRSSVAKA